ncbi:hypothetical protein ABZY14_05135 [Streptomyces sp. NPDC006617]|uniref:hypothetical protein n=1 Tax=Streptomyces sp. NPDC006617 TaxID=3155354 RepID=UPI0033ADBF37
MGKPRGFCQPWALAAGTVPGAAGDYHRTMEIERATVPHLRERELSVDGPHGQAETAERQALAALVDVIGPRHPHPVSARARHRPFRDFEPLRT